MKKTSPQLIDEAIRLYISGLSSTEISTKIGVSVGVISVAIRRAGINRTQAEAKAAQYFRNPPKVTPPEAGKIYGTTDETKQCSTCLCTFPADLNHFYKRNRENGRAYLSSSCSECVKAKRTVEARADTKKVKEVNRINYERHGKKHNATTRAKLQSNPELKLIRYATAKKWQEKNKDYMVAFRVARYIEMGEILREKCRQWHAKMPQEDKKAARQHRKALKKGAPGRYTGADLKAQYVKQNGLCFWCNVPLGDMHHGDHYIPLAKGGTNFPENIVLSCPPCNMSKGDKMPDVYLAYRELIKNSTDLINERRVYMREAMRKHRAKKYLTKAT